MTTILVILVGLFIRCCRLCWMCWLSLPSAPAQAQLVLHSSQIDIEVKRGLLALSHDKCWRSGSTSLRMSGEWLPVLVNFLFPRCPLSQNLKQWILTKFADQDRLRQKTEVMRSDRIYSMYTHTSSVDSITEHAISCLSEQASKQASIFICHSVKNTQ